MFSVYHEPKVIRNFISDEICDFLINTDTSSFHVSGVGFNGRTQQGNRHSKNRMVSLTEYGVSEIYEKCSKFTNMPLSHIEQLSVVKYEEGGFFLDHKDADPRVPRQYTIILYLNDDYEGGETEFPLLKKKYKLKKGDALFFNNYDTYGNISKQSTHRGNKVISGVKYICNVWIHSEKIKKGNLFFT
tara:strand:+ start:19 stop:579 length:561 start_codon:yes stop_codon:yes gene_type:complete